jgi:hypothetical protein
LERNAFEDRIYPGEQDRLLKEENVEDGKEGGDEKK